MTSQHTRLARFISIALGGSLLLITLSYQLSLNNIAKHLNIELASTLSKKIIGAGINDLHHELLNNYLVDRINQDLGSIQIASPINMVQQCQVRVLSLSGNSYDYPLSPSRIMTLDWSINDHPDAMTLGLNCQYHWPRLVLTQALLAILAAGMLTGIAKPLQGRRKQLVAILITNGYSRSKALQECSVIKHFCNSQYKVLDALIDQAPQHTAAMLERLSADGFKRINAEQFSWFKFGLQQHPDDFQKIIHITLAPHTLSLYLSRGRAIIHGVEIDLPSTPFLYYLWYAQQRAKDAEDGGWFINPPSNRADRQADGELIALMRQYGGHHKAIKDLEDKGLRAKTLDQNRSKIKEELSRALGDELAKPFLFDVERDNQTARFKYRIALPPANIQFYEQESDPMQVQVPASVV